MVNQYPLPREKRETPELVGNGGVKYGPFGFKIFDVADVVVEVKRAGSAWRQAAVNGASHEQGQENHEAVSVEKVDAGAAFDYFTIEFGQAIGADVSFRIKGVRRHERLSELTRGGTIIVDEMEKEASKQGVVLQEMRRDLDRVRTDRETVEVAALEAALQATVAEEAKTAAVAAAAIAEEIAGFNPALYLQKAGGTVTGSLNVTGQLSSDIGLKAGAAEYWSNGNIYGTVWADWDASGFAKQAIDARIEERASAIAEAKIAAALLAFRHNPEFSGTLKAEHVAASGYIAAHVPVPAEEDDSSDHGDIS